MLAQARHLTTSKVKETLGNLKSTLEKIDSDLKLTRFKIKDFEPRVKFQFERGKYLVKTVENGAELEACLKLRFDVFHREYRSKKRVIGVDVDKLDFDCDHLAIFDLRDGRAIGTYRLNSSLFCDTFYSTSEFQMDAVLALPGNKLELGRACIDREHRNGVVITLLWRAIAEYLQRTETKIMFGCASVKTMEPMQIASVVKLLKDRGVLTDQYGVAPTKKYKVKQLAHASEYLEREPSQYNHDETLKLIPTLLTSYLKMNAKICGEPALDRDFGCIDFLTIVEVDGMSSSYKDKYKV